MRRMNFYWGDSPMSWLRHMTLVSFRQHHPDWEMVLHSGPIVRAKTWQTVECGPEAYEGHDWREDIEALGVRIEEYIPPIPLPPQHAGDLCRWRGLARGEAHSDMDIIYCKPLPAEVIGDGLSCEDGILRVGLTSGAKDGIFADVYDAALDGYDPTRYQSLGVEAVYALAFGRRLHDVNEAFDQDTLGMLSAATGKPVANIPTAWLHPLPAHVLHSMNCPPDAVGLHWFAGLDASNIMSRDMTPENWRTYSGAIPDALSRVL